MKNVRRKKQGKKHTIGSVVAGVAGAVAMAGVAVVATLALKDEKTREKVKEEIHSIKKIATDTKKLWKKAHTGGE